MGAAARLEDELDGGLADVEVQALADVRALDEVRAGLADEREQLGELAGPAIGAALFAAGSATPFLAEAVLVALGAVLVARVRVPPLPRPDRPPHLRRDVAAHPDDTLAQRQARRAERTGVRLSVHAVWRACKRLDLRRKKKEPGPRRAGAA